MLYIDASQVIRDSELYPGLTPESDTVSLPSWDVVLADLAQIIKEDELYPEEMP